MDNALGTTHHGVKFICKFIQLNLKVNSLKITFVCLLLTDPRKIFPFFFKATDNLINLKTARSKQNK